MGLNKATLIGNLGSDPESRFTQSGACVTNFRIATNERFKNRKGEPQERTEWHRVVTYGKLAETCRDYLSKGRQVYLEGRIQTRMWEDKEGLKHYTTEIVASNVQFLGGPGPKREAKPDETRAEDVPPPGSSSDVPADDDESAPI